MKRNKGFTLVEIIVVLACLGAVTVFFWTILSSVSEDSYTINDKIVIQSSVTSLMNIIQKDVQEAKIIYTDSKKGIVEKKESTDAEENNSTKVNYEFADVTYVFSEKDKTVTRIEKSGANATYSDIVSFSITAADNTEKYGVDVSIIGGRKAVGETDRLRYSLNSTYYTRNTI